MAVCVKRLFAIVTNEHVGAVRFLAAYFASKVFGRLLPGDAFVEVDDMQVQRAARSACQDGRLPVFKLRIQLCAPSLFFFLFAFVSMRREEWPCQNVVALERAGFPDQATR